MAKTYKIHPGIGIARVGNSPDAFFIGPEVPGRPPVELSGNSEQALQSYKSGGKIKRQAARFRVFEYETDAAGATVAGREITAADADIEWKVELVNRKAGGPRILEGPDAELRNPNLTGAARDGLEIRDPRERKVGRATAQPILIEGHFLERPVVLGELRTDSAGRLLVLGGKGISGSVPTGVSIEDFANNDRWHDDVGDGPVTATITFPGQDPRPVDAPSWVIVAPPDYAPQIGGIVTLYDWAFQMAKERQWLQPPARPSYRRDILPVLQRTACHRWVNDATQWSDMSRDWPGLGIATGNAAAQARLAVFNFVTNPPIRSFEMPQFLRTLLAAWRDGDFIEDFNQPVAPDLSVSPINLDRSALEGCVGANFFPGIEASENIRRKELYAEPFRFSHAAVGAAGAMTVQMAVPWQADFYACRDEIVASWWPSQRPDDVFTAPPGPGGAPQRWIAGISGAVALLTNQNYGRLGYVMPQSDAPDATFIEVDRDNSLGGRP